LRTETLGSVISERPKDSMLLPEEAEELPCRGVYGVWVILVTLLGQCI